jgi:uncharacterized protein YnzC (UPF0291/DUF896 family)
MQARDIQDFQMQLLRKESLQELREKLKTQIQDSKTCDMQGLLV